MPQDIYSRLRGTGQVPAPHWVIERVSVPIGKERVEARKPADLAIWPEVGFTVSDSDVQTFWADASKNIPTRLNGMNLRYEEVLLLP